MQFRFHVGHILHRFVKIRSLCVLIKSNFVKNEITKISVFNN